MYLHIFVRLRVMLYRFSLFYNNVYILTITGPHSAGMQHQENKNFPREQIADCRDGKVSPGCSESDKTSCFPGERTPQLPYMSSSSSSLPPSSVPVGNGKSTGMVFMDFRVLRTTGNRPTIPIAHTRSEWEKIFSMQFSKPYVRKST